MGKKQCCECPCFYSKVVDEGVCRRHAPKPILSDPREDPAAIKAVWPAVDGEEPLCGDSPIALRKMPWVEKKNKKGSKKGTKDEDDGHEG